MTMLAPTTFEIPAYWIFYTLDPLPPYQMHPDHHEIVFHPDYDGTTNQTLYVGNDGGLFRTNNARAPTSYSASCRLHAPMHARPELSSTARAQVARCVGSSKASRSTSAKNSSIATALAGWRCT